MDIQVDPETQKEFFGKCGQNEKKKLDLQYMKVKAL